MHEYKNEEANIWLARHPVWVRILGWVMIPIILVCGVYVAVIPVIESRYEIVVIASCLFLGGGVIYMSMLAFKVFPYLRVDVEFGEAGFSIYWPNKQHKNYKWSNVGKLVHHASVQVLVVKNIAGETILALTEQAYSYEKFVELSSEKTGLRY